METRKFLRSKNFVALKLRSNFKMKELIFKEVERVPEPYLIELLDFIHFLETKALERRMETAILSESSLKKDWLRPEEDEAWRDL